MYYHGDECILEKLVNTGIGTGNFSCLYLVSEAHHTLHNIVACNSYFLPLIFHVTLGNIVELCSQEITVTSNNVA